MPSPTKMDKSFLANLNVIFTLSQSSWDLTLNFFWGRLPLSCHHWLSSWEPLSKMWVLSSHGDLEEGSLCAYSSLLWRAACSPYLCLLLGWSFGLVLTVSYYKLKLQKILNIRFSHLKKRCDGNPEQSVLCVDDKLFCCFSSFYPSDLVLIHLHKTVFLSSCRVI